jgi:hypothetical protein
MSCADCGQGTYARDSGASSCLECGVGTYSDATGASECTSCGHASLHLTSPTGSISESDCVCDRGYEASGTECVACPAGTFSRNIGGQACDDCRPGTYADTTARTYCTDCPSGKYNEYYGQSSSTSCTSCPANSNTPGPGFDSVSLCMCVRGYYALGSGDEEEGSNSGQCVACPDNTVMFQPSFGAWSCRCAVGFYRSTADTDNLQCLECPDNSHSDDGATCQCNAGYTGADTSHGSGGTGGCTACEAGKFKGMRGSDSCIDCSPGFISQQGGTECQQCAASVTCSGSCECSPGYGITSGTITDGSGDYPNSAYCQWTISSQSEITLSFSEFNTESNYDYVYVNECEDANCNRYNELDRLDGSGQSGATINGQFCPGSDIVVLGDGCVPGPPHYDPEGMECGGGYCSYEVGPNACARCDSGMGGGATSYTSTTGHLQVVFTSDGSATRSGFVGAWALPDTGVIQCPAGRRSVNMVAGNSHLRRKRRMAAQSLATSDTKPAGVASSSRANGQAASRRLLTTGQALALADHSASICGPTTGNNTAKYGPCVASDYRSLAVMSMPSAASPAHAGENFQVEVLKKDIYNQTMTSDSASGITAFTSLNGQRSSDPSINLLGQVFNELRQGKAVFEFALTPSYSEVSSANEITRLLRQPQLYFQGADAVSGNKMESQILPATLASGESVCRSGYVLDLKPGAAGGRSGQCSVCRAGTYSIFPLAQTSSSLESSPDTPSCLQCPAGGDCTNGGDDIKFLRGNWSNQKTFYKLESCPQGYKVQNTEVQGQTPVFSHDAQTCELCGKGEECLLSVCTECTLCQPGYYKPAVGIDACSPCPANTYREDPGAQALSGCISCLPKSSTDGSGHSSWSACKCDSGYYRIVQQSAQDGCLDCPPGLTCHGDATLDPVVSGSSWVVDGAIFRLQTCPVGHYVSPRASETFNAALQQCLPCGKGEECTDEACIECSACAPGMYKAAVSTDPCVPCPANTYRETTGASDLGMCLACQAKSSTNGTGQSSRRACECDIEYYLITTDQGLATESLLCQPCPKGAVCANGECALRNADLSCSDGSSIEGTWILNNQTRQFDLAACRAGYEQRTTAEMGSADLQICHKCLTTQYIISYTDICQDCPAGLTCQGDDVVVRLVENSTWLAEDGIYKLSTCPTGYEKIRVDGQWTQQKCEPCTEGSECTLAVCDTCSHCPPGLYKDTKGTAACRTCPQNTYNPVSNAKSIASCINCPANSDTDGKDGQTSSESCACGSRFYSAGGGSGSALVCANCPAGALCPDGSCAFNTGKSNTAGTCPGADNPIPGTWVKTTSGKFELISCPMGYQKMGDLDSHDQQACEACPKGSHCTLEACEICTECAPGYYKAAVGTEACAKCPINTFRKDPGATALDNCEACPTGADTRGKTAMTTLDDCKCSDRLYSYSTVEEPLKCSTCPRGAVCLVSICGIRSRSAARTLTEGRWSEV